MKKDKERELKKKNAELQSKVENLEKKCAVLEVSKKYYFFHMNSWYFQTKEDLISKRGKSIVWNTNIVTSLDIRVFSSLYLLLLFFSKDVLHYSMYLLVKWFDLEFMRFAFQIMRLCRWINLAIGS